MDSQLLYVLLAGAALSVIAAGLKWWKVVKSRPEDDVSSLAGAILMTLVATCLAGLVSGFGDKISRSGKSMHQGSDNQNGYDSDQGRTQRAPTIPGATGRPAGETND